MSQTITAAVPFEAETTRARRAQLAWAKVPLRKRLVPLRELRHRIVEGADALCAAVARDIGKEPHETLGAELLPLADACLFLERQAERILRPRRVPSSDRPFWLRGQTDTVYRRPHGVVGIIGTWNYPHLLNGTQILQSLVAGNAVLWKPSEIAPNSATALSDLLGQVGLPPDLLLLLPANRESGALLTEAAIDHLIFTGSVPVGRQIAKRLGERLVSSSLELSGCDAMFVLEDADVDLAARAAWFGCVLNNGQTCIAVRRVFVHRAVYEPFCGKLRTQAQEATPRRLAQPAQVSQARRLVREALEDGARLLIDRPDGPDDAFPPTIVLDAKATSSLCREASFAPLSAVIPVDSMEVALELDASCPYALGASIFTKKLAQAGNLATLLRAGSVIFNDVIVGTGHPATPFGGRGSSGWGYTQGEEGLLALTVPQVVSLRSDRFRPHYDMVKPGAAVQQGELLGGMLRATHSRTLWQRLRGWWQTIRAFWRSR
jgi:acyl-CoA reductase-like NAD-dependent aldehyde dehydrogenase